MNSNNDENPCPVCPKKINYTQDKFKEDFEKYISVVKDKDRADDSEYKRRLDICSACKYLSNGLCTQCGCYVQIRCVLRTAVCPAPKRMW